MKKLITVAVLVASIASFSAWGQTCPSTYNYQTKNSTGQWLTASDWNSNPGYATNQSYTFNGTTYNNCVIIPASDVVQVIASNFHLANQNLVVQGKLTFDGGKLNLDQGYSIIVASGGLVCCTGTCNASDVISIGSGGTAVNVWGGGGGSTAPVAGPASSNGSGPLPIMLALFNAKVQSYSVALSWSTLSEVNFDYFSLQRSSDGKSFTEIAQIKGNGTSNEVHNYSHEDTDPIIGRSYYRLTSNDFDGYQETFKVVSIEYHGGKSFHVSPNPSDGSSVKLNFNFESDADAQVTIFDNVGSLLGTYRVSGSGAINFENTLKSGVYLAKYTSSSFTKTERFLVK